MLLADDENAADDWEVEWAPGMDLEHEDDDYEEASRTFVRPLESCATFNALLCHNVLEQTALTLSAASRCRLASAKRRASGYRRRCGASTPPRSSCRPATAATAAWPFAARSLCRRVGVDQRLGEQGRSSWTGLPTHAALHTVCCRTLECRMPAKLIDVALQAGLPAAMVAAVATSGRSWTTRSTPSALFGGRHV